MARYARRERIRASRNEEARAKKAAAEIKQNEGQIDEASRALVIPPSGLLLELRDAKEATLALEEEDVLFKLDQLDKWTELEGEVIAPTPASAAPMQGYPAVVGGGRLALEMPHASLASTPAARPARSITAHISNQRREAHPVVPDAVKLAFHIVTSGAVLAIEYAILHTALDTAFPPILGQESVPTGLVACMSGTAVIAGVSALGNAGARLKGFLTKGSQVAIGAFLAGATLFSYDALATSLSSSVSAENFDLTDTGSLGWQGSTGLGLMFGSASFIAWSASHYGLSRAKSLFNRISVSLANRREVDRLEHDHLAISAERISLALRLERIRRDLTNIDHVTAQRASTLCAPALAAARKLLTQLDLSGGALANLIPDPLTQEALQYDRDQLRLIVERFEVETQPAALLATMRGAFPARRKYQRKAS